MNDTLKLIDQLIIEHKAINEKTESLEKVANDASLLDDLADAKGTFVPGRFDQSQSLKELEEMLASIETWLDHHFVREETILLDAVKKGGDPKFISALNSLLLEHTDLRNRIAHAKQHVAELLGGGLGRHQWDASANDMRTHLAHTRKLLGNHAAMENELFHELRRYLEESAN